jgi:hypothetical protein
MRSSPIVPKAVRPARVRQQLEVSRRARIRQLFSAHHPKEATEDHVCLFFRWLQQHHLEMLPKGDDPYLALRTELDGLYRDRIGSGAVWRSGADKPAQIGAVAAQDSPNAPMKPSPD